MAIFSFSLNWRSSASKLGFRFSKRASISISAVLPLAAVPDTPQARDAEYAELDTGGIFSLASAVCGQIPVGAYLASATAWPLP